MKWIVRFFCCVMISLSAAHAGHTVFSMAGGSAWTNTPSHLTVSNIERDTLHQTNANSAWIESIGFGYEFPYASKWVQTILIGANLYNVNFKNKGTVYQFGDADLNNFNYHLAVNTTRLMLDVKAASCAWYSFTPYVIAGIGESWNRASYHDYVPINHVTSIALSNREQLKFAYEAGLGVQYALSSSFSIFAEYLYANLGEVKTSAFGDINVVSAPSVSLHVNSVLLGFTFIPRMS